MCQLFALSCNTPSAVTFQVRLPDGTESSYDDADPEVDNPSTGVWTLSYVIADNIPGRWAVRARGTTGVLAADEDSFYVAPSVFATP